MPGNDCKCRCKKQKPLKRHPSKLKKDERLHDTDADPRISIVAVLFAFPLYWIITGSFKTGAAINATTPRMVAQPVGAHQLPETVCGQKRSAVAAGRAVRLQVQRRRRAHLLLGRPHRPGGHPLDGQHRLHGGRLHDPHLHHRRNGRLCAGKKRFVGRKLLFTLIVCAMALPKQVILIPLLREMSSL